MNVALTIAGSDSGGGAGVQADLKTFHQFGVFGTTALVAVTAQNTRRVAAVHPIPLAIVRAQLDELADDLPPDAVKTGMLATAALVAAVADAIRHHALQPLVVDPVMVASSGAKLLDADAVDTVLDRLVPLATLLTPNVPEASLLAGTPIRDPADMERAGGVLLARGAGAVLVKGGHLRGADAVDVLVTPSGTETFARPRIDTRNTHGTGCTLSAAVTAALALGEPLPAAVRRGLDFVHRAIAAAPGLGAGHGPLNHFVHPGAP